MATFNDLALRAIGDDFAAAKIPDAKRYVRQAVASIYRTASLAQGDLQGTVTLTAGQSESQEYVNVPGLRVTSLYHADGAGTPVDVISPDDLFVMRAQNTALRGKPRYVALSQVGFELEDAATFFFYPAADRTYTFWVSGRKAVGELESDDAEQVPLPEVYEEAPVYYARSELFAFAEDDFGMSDAWLARWENKTRELRADLNRRSTGNRQVPGTWSRGSSAPSFRHPRGLF